ncbi:MAG: hypothetical protein ACI9MC_004036 [Kiritimatiellia bacterium]|jgi:hypothetical protein
MSLPSFSLLTALLCGLAMAVPTYAADFEAPTLPPNLSATPLPHVDKPFPEGGGLSYKRNGPSPWMLTAVALVASSGVTAGLAKAQDKRMRGASDQEALDKAFSTQKTMAWASVGLLGGAGVSFALSKVL